MIVTLIGGRLYRIRIGENIYSWEPIPLDFRNSGIIKQAWMQQTVETLVIQDGQSDPILYNGSTARRAGPTEVPRGRQMAYGNGRLWVAINRNELVAGDIRQRTPGSELFFTETNYLAGGGALYFPRGITGLEFIPVTGAADFGTLIVFGEDYAESIRADVTTRDQWGMPGFVTTVFRDIGASGDWCIAQVNQDLYFRDSNGNIRSLANSISTNNSPGSTPISREVSRIVGYDSEQLLPWVSTIYFNNRLLMTASPYLNVSGGISFREMVSLDFSPISTMQVKAPPAYDGTWQGIPGIAQIVTGQFGGENRAFAISSDEEGINRIWEIYAEGDGRDDISLSCGSGIVTETPIQSFIEYPAVNFGNEKQRKRLERCDVWISGLDGPLDLDVYWRPDNNQRWTAWDENIRTCAKTTDAETSEPHSWKNLLPEQRPQIKTFTIPAGIDAVTKYALQNGFFHQIRIAWTGKCKIEKVLLSATYLDDPDFAHRYTVYEECIENDVSGNEINYFIPTSAGYLYVFPPDSFNPIGPFGGPFADSSGVYTIRNLSAEAIEWTLTSSAAWLVPDISGGTLEPGEDLDVTVTLDADTLDSGDYDSTLSFNNLTNMCGDAQFVVNLIVQSDFPGETISFVQFDGPFVYPACATPYGVGFYLTESASGENYVKYAPIAGDVQLRACSLFGIPPAYGLVWTEWNGSSTLDMECNVTGDLSVTLSRQGTMGAYDAQNPPTVETFTGGSVSDLMEQLFDPAAPGRRAAFMYENYEEFLGQEGDTVIRRYTSPDAPQGYFAGQFGGWYDSIWCQGYTMESILSNPVTVEMLGKAIARSGGYGDPAWTQTMSSFSGTTHNGNKSRALITVPVDTSRDSLTGEFIFTVDPDVGDTYTLTVLKDFDITVTPLTGFVDYPTIADATITLSSWSYSYNKTFSEDYNSLMVGETWFIASTPSWPNPATFLAPAPNTDFRDDLEDYPDNADTQITTQPYGFGWAGIGRFVGTDPLDFYDDYEGYPVGNITILAQGVGWAGAGALTVVNYLDFYDDYESYPVGTITALTFKNFNNNWSGDGSFLVVQYPTFWDDYESYSTGTITVYNYTATDNDWDGDGRSLISPSDPNPP